MLNRDQEIVEAFAGELFAMHAAAVAASRAAAMVEVPHRFDAVVTTNGGYPLDQNLYQTVKGMSAGAEIVADGGLVLVAAECRDGFPSFGNFRSLLESATSPEALLASLAGQRTVPDQWQAQVLARIQSLVRVVVHCSGLSATDLELAKLIPVPDIAAALRSELSRLGDGATCCVLPEGPQTIPFVRAG